VEERDLSIDRITRSRRNLFTSVRLDRLAEYRDDADWVGRALRSAEARFVPLWRNRSLLVGDDPEQAAVYLAPGQVGAPADTSQVTLLGTDGKRYFFAAALDDEQKERVLESHPGARFHDLRLASIDMDAKHAGILAYAKALLYWQYRHAFCGRCGHRNSTGSAGHKLVCSNPGCLAESFRASIRP
jgi:NAD+ diphosphatase